ncbi:MAG: hypothetical protein ABJF50_11870 [Paracoccaceae bacterium]
MAKSKLYVFENIRNAAHLAPRFVFLGFNSPAVAPIYVEEDQPMMTLSKSALTYFLSLLPPERITREAGRVTVHADIGDAVWHARGNFWITAAPEFESAQRSGVVGQTLH